jgi:hypothetical protein
MIYEAPEHEFEASHGLPASLPPGEHIVWQGSPDMWALARHAFHVPALIGYFGLLLALRGTFVMSDGLGLIEAARSVAILLPLAAIGVGLVILLAWLTARSAVYTLTNRRVVMRLGIVLGITFNLPLKTIVSAGLKMHKDDTGDIPLTLTDEYNIAYPHLWPHARPWQLRRTQPMLRCIPNARAVGAMLAEAAAGANPGSSASTVSAGVTSSSAQNVTSTNVPAAA